MGLMLDVRHDGAVLRLTLDRPEVRNAFDDHLVAALTQAVSGDVSGIRAIVIAGNGKAFSAGGDANWMRRTASLSFDENVVDAGRVAALFAAIERAPVPTVAAIHGACFGGGCGIAAACDLAIAEEGSTFAFSEVRLGLIPATISPFVIRRIGVGAARSLFVSGAPFGADEALRIGLVSRVVPAGGLSQAVDETVAGLLKNAPGAMIAARDLALDGPLPLEDVAHRLASARASDEGREGVTAFLEKRRANFVTE